MSEKPFLLGVLKLGNIGTSPILELLFDERADRKNFNVIVVGSGAKMDEAAAEKIAKILIEQKPQVVLIPSPNAGLKGPAKAREMVKAAGIPVIILSDMLKKDEREALAQEGYGYILLQADSMIGARREFLDPVEMSLFNADVIRVLAATGAFRLVQIELDKVFANIMAGKTPKLPTIVVSATKAAAAGHFSNPYAHAKAHAAYELAASVANISVTGCFKTKEREKYIALVAAAHETMRAAARLADEARELEKDGDSVCRSPHLKDGKIGRKIKLHDKPT